jgi:dTDP-4-dehydrorhamnose 3,5-epimerase
MKFTSTSIPEVVLLEPKVFGDRRGFFMESWNEKVFFEGGINARFVQDGHSRSAQGVLRGLHYQVENTQGKLIRVIAGEIFDVAVDLRKSSPTFGKSVSVRLNAIDHRMLWIPPGFAHGFYVISEYAEVLYNLTNFYSPQHERSILWNDPDLAIDWPLDGPPSLSEKDAVGVSFKQAEVFS